MNRKTLILIGNRKLREIINSPGFQPGVIKKKIPLLAILFVFTNLAFAQQAYHGGSGDGYASATAKTVALDINGNVQKPSIQFSIYPNPATTNQNTTVLVKGEGCSLAIYTIEGKKLYFVPRYNSGESIPALPAGTYLVKMENEEAFSVQKLIVLPGK